MEDGASAIRLVVNADDFGLDEAISGGILRAHEEGIVTSTSVLGNLGDLDSARRLLQSAPRLGVGAHLTLLHGPPVAEATKKSTLVDPSGRFPDEARAVVLRWARNELTEVDLEVEFEAQLERLESVGLVLDHLDTHAPIGVLPVVARVMERLARRHRIPSLRTNLERPNLSWFVDPRRGLPLLALQTLSKVARKELGALKHGPQSWGFAESGRLDTVRILEIVGRFGPGAHELICHPALREPPGLRPGYDGVAELSALTSSTVRVALQRRGVRLCTFRELF